MSTISETFLPGVGRKFQVETTGGDRLVIVIHDDGTRELYHFARKNLDRPASVLRLSDDNDDDQPHVFAPHFGRTLKSLNNALPNRISDHSPVMVDLPLDEPRLVRGKRRRAAAR